METLKKSAIDIRVYKRGGNSMRIAFSGVFDLKNYGDHLFYILFEQEMKTRNIDFQMDLFSTFEFEHEFYGKRKIYALENLEKMHLENPYDAFIVGGGGIINLLYSFQRLNSEEFIKYSFGDLWLIPAMVGAKYGVKCIWNSPEVPNRFTDECKDFVKNICDTLDYISVRDKKSKDYLLECDVKDEKVDVIPDTALIVHKYFSKEVLEKKAKEVLGTDKQFIVFHANRWIPEESFEELDKIFAYAKTQGYETVLLPLAYTHGDDEILLKIKESIAEKVYLPDKELDAFEMLSILGSATMYLGVSFHGAVTSLQYGRKAIAYDYMHNKKMKNLFEQYGDSGYYVTDSTQLLEKVKRIMGDTVDNSDVVNRTDAIIEKHFDKIFNIIEDKDYKKCLADNLITTVSRGFDATNFSIMNHEKEACDRKDEIANLQKELLNYADALHHNEGRVEQLEKDLVETQELLKFFKSKSEDFEKTLNETQELMKYFKAAYEDSEGRIEKIKSKPMWKIMQKMYKDV